MVGINSDRDGVAVSERSPRARMKSRIQVNPPMSSMLPAQSRKSSGICPQMQSKSQFTEIQQRLHLCNTQIRRDSNSTVSSYYGSMRSADMSRKSGLTSQGSTMRQGMGTSSFYDSISAFTSRRSSQFSTNTNGGTCVPPSPPSQLLAGQLQRLQNS
ncbi:hypothetical protein WA026_019283 [Henosepilachna vigintioctopunctata]|uniref:Uncharacterized protein n=1 Tax=Henosepilachna vigintioctopunctata TaxID=420089 RepID=A0AAW1U4V6_9CUCU